MPFVLGFFYLARMKNYSFVSVFFLILSLFSCNEDKTDAVTQQNKNSVEKRIKFKLNTKIYKTRLSDSISRKDKNFKNLIENFEDSIYTLELLRDKTKQNLSYIHPLTLRRKISLLDTPAIKSRFVLTHVHLKKLNYLINKKNIEPDTIEQTLNRIVYDLNNVIQIAEKYNNQRDEFQEILEYDSIVNDTNKKEKISVLPNLLKNKK
jgi:hypothetical protein